jgi:alkanesulfonate monooxygenase SsuD/methylene tetrahydromethanopterin reductase-like flavin-dependent oxidoreductase (luciferase family)
VPTLTLRYDLRCPPFAKVSPADLYAAALEQCAWADRLGFAAVILSEHHGSPDGYLPSPLVFGAAVAARTRSLRIQLAALIAPLHDPLRLAEDIAVLDVLSGGRVIPVLSGGYVESEFQAFGRRLADRPRVMEEIVPFLERAWSGEPFVHQGRRVRVTPRPLQQPRPPIFWGAAGGAAAPPAAPHADYLIPQLPAFFEIFRQERMRLGKPDPGPLPPTTGNFVWVAEDPDAAWARLAPHAMHEMNAYGRWMAEAGTAGPYRPIEDPGELRRTGSYPVLTPAQLVEQVRSLGPSCAILLHPLVGGVDPELSWESLELFERKVLPAIQG